MANIFMVSDTGLGTLLDGMAEKLHARGHHIVRGPLDTAGRMKIYTADERQEFIDAADVAVFTPRHRCSRDIMAGSARLRGVCYPVIGVESLDLDAANEIGIIVGNGAVRGNIVGMAESTVMLMLMLFYGVLTNIRLVVERKWRRPGHHSHQMEGKTIGLIGFGRIAREVAQRLEPWGVTLLTYSPRAQQQNLPAGVTKVSLERLLRESDAVCVLTGLTPETHGMLDAGKLSLMKSTAYLVNTGRGAVIDETALHQALRDGVIAGAALDTFTIEPLPQDSPLRDLPNVILTPHCVGHTVEGWDQFGPALLENVERILAGSLPLHCKNPEAEPAWRARLAAIAPEQ